jgi:hypothetical protein
MSRRIAFELMIALSAARFSLRFRKALFNKKALSQILSLTAIIFSYASKKYIGMHELRSLLLNFLCVKIATS